MRLIWLMSLDHSPSFWELRVETQANKWMQNIVHWLPHNQGRTQQISCTPQQVAPPTLETAAPDPPSPAALHVGTAATCIRPGHSCPPGDIGPLLTLAHSSSDLWRTTTRSQWCSCRADKLSPHKGAQRTVHKRLGLLQEGLHTGLQIDFNQHRRPGIKSSIQKD